MIPFGRASYKIAAKCVIIASCAIMLSGCGNGYKPAVLDPGKIRIGTFNMEWLGDGINDVKAREESDYKRIAEMIKSTGIDMLAVEEVENSAGLSRVMKYLRGFKFALGKGGGNQNIGFIYKEGISLTIIGEYVPVAPENGGGRPGLIAQARYKNFDWLMMAVHLKSTSRHDDTPEKKEASKEIRAAQSSAIARWADSVLSLKEKDVIILGDFNDNPLRARTRLAELKSDNNLVFLTDRMRSCSNPGWDNIDHIVVSLPARKRLVRDTQFMYNFKSALPEAESMKISDHCPVSADFEVTTPDND